MAMGESTWSAAPLHIGHRRTDTGRRSGEFYEAGECFDPLRRIFRVEEDGFEGRADKLARGGERGEMAEGDGLEDDVAEGGSFGGASNHRATGGVGGKLVQERVLA